jgi:hypothetical protein
MSTSPQDFNAQIIEEFRRVGIQPTASLSRF